MALASPSDLERVLRAALPFSRVLRLVPLFSSFPFKLWLFFYVPGQMNLLTALSAIPPTAIPQHLRRVGGCFLC